MKSGLRRDDEDFDRWYLDAYVPVLRAARKVASGAAEAEDAAAVAFVKAYERWWRVRRMRSPTGWACRVAANEARRGHRGTVELPEVATKGAVGAEDTVDFASQLEELPPQTAKTMYLRYVMDMRQRDIAELMNVSPGTVATQLNRGRRLMREILSR
jgi:RNA polymerase sigma-70 factor (ECF subfamily)